MTQYGSFDLYTQSDGWISVPVFKANEVPYAPLEVYTPNGWAAFNLVNPTDADTPLEIYTPSGWRGIKSTLTEVIDSFESGSLSAYTIGENPSTYISHGITSDTSAPHGDNVLYIDVDNNSGTAWLYSMPGDGLQNYPQYGDTFRMRFHFTVSDPVIEMSYGLQNVNEDYPPGYKPRIRGNNFAIRYTRPSGTTYSLSDVTIDTSLFDNEWAIMEATWGTNRTQHARLLHPDGTEIASLQGTPYPDEPDYTDGGVGWRAGTATGPDTTRLKIDYGHIL